MESATPVPPIRSTKGCYTCRLRKKKCDESFPPSCLRCESVNIKCYYGNKPNWIENKDLGKIELAKIKQQVAISASRKRAAHREKKLLEASPSRARSTDIEEFTATTKGLSTKKTRTQNDTSGILKSRERIPPESTLFTNWIGDQEANLIMHYLDHVFYIQFRFYTSSISDGGRGWLLSLLTRTKPLYHAALSLSAFHQQSLMIQEKGGIVSGYLEELETQHNLTLKELQLFIQAHSSKSSTNGAYDRNIQILACVVQLISFELFNGGASNWQVHLRAASELVLVLHNIAASSSDSHYARYDERESSAASRSALKFLTGCIIWFDALACISTSCRSYLGKYHGLLLSSSPMQKDVIELHTISGCYSWILEIIAEIAALSEEESKRSHSGSHPSGISDEFQSVQLRLESNWKILQSEKDTLFQLYHGHPPHSSIDAYNKYVVLIVTTIFALAAKIYLNMSSYSGLTPEQIHAVIEEVMAAVKTLPDSRMVRGLLWPICVTGCAASTIHHQEIFRSAVVGAVNDSRSFGNSGEVLEILETSWRIQNERGSWVDCQTTIRELGNCVLLV